MFVISQNVRVGEQVLRILCFLGSEQATSSSPCCQLHIAKRESHRQLHDLSIRLSVAGDS